MMTEAGPEQGQTTSSPAVSVIEPPSSFEVRWEALAIGLLMLVAFWPILYSMYGSWFDEGAYMEHGILVVPAAVYMAWTKKDKLQRTPRRPSAWGLALLLVGALQAMLGIAAQWVWVSRMAFLVSLLGGIVAIYGWRMVRELIYPLCTLILMVAPPTFVFERLTLSLQLLASRLGETCLEALGYSVLRQGNILEMVGIKLSVEEACSGIRSLMAIFFMCVLYNYFFVNGRWMRAFILVMAIPIAILGNALRIVATGVASQYNPALVRGTPHEAFGYASVVIAALGCVGLHVGASALARRWRVHHA
jgi:exosortase